MGLSGCEGILTIP